MSVGIAATVKHVNFRSIETLRVEGNLIVERACERDGIAIVEQIGAFTA